MIFFLKKKYCIEEPYETHLALRILSGFGDTTKKKSFYQKNRLGQKKEKCLFHKPFREFKASETNTFLTFIIDT